MTISTEELRKLLDEVTPGPWKADESPVFGDYYVRNDPVNWNGQGYRWIANVNGGCGRGEAELIAAAPDLAAEVIRLREALVRIEQHYTDTDLAAKHMAAIARAALNKETK